MAAPLKNAADSVAILALRRSLHCSSAASAANPDGKGFVHKVWEEVKETAHSAKDALVNESEKKKKERKDAQWTLDNIGDSMNQAYDTAKEKTKKAYGGVRDEGKEEFEKPPEKKKSG